MVSNHFSSPLQGQLRKQLLQAVTLRDVRLAHLGKDNCHKKVETKVKVNGRVDHRPLIADTLASLRERKGGTKVKANGRVTDHSDRRDHRPSITKTLASLRERKGVSKAHLLPNSPTKQRVMKLVAKEKWNRTLAPKRANRVNRISVGFKPKGWWKDKRVEESISNDNAFALDPLQRSLNVGNTVLQIPGEEGLYAPLTAYGLRFWANVDTGATISIVRQDIAWRLIDRARDQGHLVDIYDSDMLVSTADGGDWNLSHKVYLDYELGGVPFRWSFFISSKICDEMIMGLDDMRCHAMNICVGKKGERDYIHMREHNIDIACQRTGAGLITSSVVQLVVPKATVLRPNSLNEVSLMIPAGTYIEWPSDDNVTGIVRNIPGLDKHKGLTVAKPTIEEIKQGRVRAFINNDSRHSIRLFPGETVAEFAPKRVRQHADRQGNVYLYRDAMDKLCQRVDVCEPWEDFEKGVAALEKCRPIGVLPVAKRVLVISNKGTSLEKRCYELRPVSTGEQAMILRNTLKEVRSRSAYATSTASNPNKITINKKHKNKTHNPGILDIDNHAPAVDTKPKHKGHDQRTDHLCAKFNKDNGNLIDNSDNKESRNIINETCVEYSTGFAKHDQPSRTKVHLATTGDDQPSRTKVHLASDWR